MQKVARKQEYELIIHGEKLHGALDAGAQGGRQGAPDEGRWFYSKTRRIRRPGESITEICRLSVTTAGTWAENADQSDAVWEPAARFARKAEGRRTCKRGGEGRHHREEPGRRWHKQSPRDHGQSGQCPGARNSPRTSIALFR